MKFQPKTEEELQSEQLCKEQDCAFTVMESSEAVSKKGTPMIKLKLNVHAEEYDSHLYEYISPGFMAHKFRHFFVAVGLESLYESGEIPADGLVGKQGWCRLGIQKAKGDYGPKNIVTDYILNPVTKSQATPVENDDVPF